MPAAAEPAPITPRLAAAWAAFCLLVLLVGLQERWYAGEPVWPWPLFYEAASMAVATLIAAWRWTPLVALAFVVLLYGPRHTVRAGFGLPYPHQPRPEVLAYESPKFSVFYLLFAGVQHRRQHGGAASTGAGRRHGGGIDHRADLRRRSCHSAARAAQRLAAALAGVVVIGPPGPGAAAQRTPGRLSLPRTRDDRPPPPARTAPRWVRKPAYRARMHRARLAA